LAEKAAIEKAEETIEVLKADIQLYIETAAKLTKEIAQHDEDIAAWKGDIKAATFVRSTEKDDYDEIHKDYSESVDAMERAIKVLDKQAFDRPQALVELSTVKSLKRMPEKTKRMIDAFLAEDDSPMDVSAPEAEGYEFQSNGVIEMLEKLLDKFKQERTKLEKDETKTKHAYEMLMQDLEDQTDQAEQDRTLKSSIKAKKLQAKADASGDLTDVTATKDADVKYLDDLTAECDQKAADFEARQQLRAEEIEAVEKAIEILASNAVSGNAGKHLPTLLQNMPESLVQIQASLESDTRVRLTSYLRNQGKQLKSQMLLVLADRAEADPFKKVKKMMRDMINRLIEEANDEAEHKGWCDRSLQQMSRPELKRQKQWRHSLPRLTAWKLQLLS